MKFKYALTIFCLFAVLTLTSAYAQDNWLGGQGNWSTGVKWSLGVPNAGSDVLIYSGAIDYVTLDRTATINSLTLGGTNNGWYSLLTDSFTPQKLTMAQSLTVGQTGVLLFYGGFCKVHPTGTIWHLPDGTPRCEGCHPNAGAKCPPFKQPTGKELFG